MSQNLIGGKYRKALTADEKQFIRDALRTEAVLIGNNDTRNAILHKLGIQDTPEKDVTPCR